MTLYSAQTGVWNPRTNSFEDQAMGFRFFSAILIIMFRAKGLDSLVAPPQKKVTSTILTIFILKNHAG